MMAQYLFQVACYVHGATIDHKVAQNQSVSLSATCDSNREEEEDHVCVPQDHMLVCSLARPLPHFFFEACKLHISYEYVGKGTSMYHSDGIS